MSMLRWSGQSFMVWLPSWDWLAEPMTLNWFFNFVCLNPNFSSFAKSSEGKHCKSLLFSALHIDKWTWVSNASVLNDWQMNLLEIALCVPSPWTASLLSALYLQKNEVMTWWIQSNQFALRCLQTLLEKPQRKLQKSWSSPSQIHLPKWKHSRVQVRWWVSLYRGG